MSGMDDETRAGDPTNDATSDPYAHPEEPGAYIGNRPEREAETIPGGITDDDERIAAHSTQAAPVLDESANPPERREAGQSR